MRILIIEDDAAGALTPSAGAAVADGPEAEALLDQLRRRLDGNRGADSLWGGMARFGEVVVEYATQRIVRAGHGGLRARPSYGYRTDSVRTPQNELTTYSGLYESIFDRSPDGYCVNQHSCCRQ